MARNNSQPSGYRIAIRCTGSKSGLHRWRVRQIPDAPPAWDWWCQRCRNWLIDVIEQPVTPKVTRPGWRIAE